MYVHYQRLLNKKSLILCNNHCVCNNFGCFFPLLWVYIMLLLSPNTFCSVLGLCFDYALILVLMSIYMSQAWHHSFVLPFVCLYVYAASVNQALTALRDKRNNIITFLKIRQWQNGLYFKMYSRIHASSFHFPHHVFID